MMKRRIAGLRQYFGFESQHVDQRVCVEALETVVWVLVVTVQLSWSTNLLGGQNLMSWKVIVMLN